MLRCMKYGEDRDFKVGECKGYGPLWYLSNHMALHPKRRETSFVSAPVKMNLLGKLAHEARKTKFVSHATSA
jgi:hypothetical protein